MTCDRRPRPARTAALLMALVGMLCGCGDPLAVRGYAGEPLFRVEGIITDYRQPIDLEQEQELDLTASVLWSLTGATSKDPAELAEQNSVGVRVTFPATLLINIFEAPSDPRLAALSDPYIFGEILIYADEDGDGRYGQGELRGGAWNSGILFAHAPVAKEDSPTGKLLPQGFSLVKLPLPCRPQTAPVIPDDSGCDVPLGAPCSGPNDCGTAGSCLLHDGWLEYPGGSCVQPSHGPCQPGLGVLIAVDPEYGVLVPAIGEGDVGVNASEHQDQHDTAEDDPYTWVWTKPCLSDHDCRNDDYECDVTWTVCWPRSPVLFDVWPDFEPPALCWDPSQE